MSSFVFQKKSQAIAKSICYAFIILTFTQCNNKRLPPEDADNGGLYLPGDFQAVVVADSLGAARHIAVNDNGDVYVKLRASYPNGSNIALRDENNDGKADVIER